MPGEAQPVQAGDVCPLDGIVMPVDQAAALAAGYEACRESLVVERQHAAAQQGLYLDALEALDDACTDALDDATAPAWWSSGWTWALVGVAVGLGVGIGYKIPHL